MTAALAWIAVLLGWAGSWMCGRRSEAGWLVLVASGAVWLVVNARLGLWAGLAQAVVGSALCLRNWQKWRAMDRDAVER